MLRRGARCNVDNSFVTRINRKKKKTSGKGEKVAWTFKAAIEGREKSKKKHTQKYGSYVFKVMFQKENRQKGGHVHLITRSPDTVTILATPDLLPSALTAPAPPARPLIRECASPSAPFAAAAPPR